MSGELALVLHAHLPFVRHPEHRYHLEENWLYEALVATYLPLLDVFERLRHDHIPWRATLSLSPPLCAMLRDELLVGRAHAYMRRLVELGDRELHRTAHDPTFHGLAGYYRARFERLLHLYERVGKDVVGAFRGLQESGHLEIITVGATHGYLPAIPNRAARRAQIEVACRDYERHFGRRPRGIWLPECGYIAGLDAQLAESGLRFFFVDAHALTLARPRPPLGTLAPIYTPSGVAAFARDLDSGKQVWSSKEGYPGDAVYRDFYRDIGFDLPLEQIGPYIHPDGIRVNTGYKYFRVTGSAVGLANKAPYDPAWADSRVTEHAADFVHKRRAQVGYWAERMDRPPLVVAPYDAELFGHWWFEGPRFIDQVAREIARQGDALRMTTPMEHLARQPTQAVARPNPSSWGAGGYSEVWLDGTNDWLYRHVHHAEDRMQRLVADHGRNSNGVVQRALRQAGRELLLMQSSDWAFIMQTGTAVRYAVDRAKTHVARFAKLDEQLSALAHGGALDERWLGELEGRDNIFPDLDVQLWS